MKAAVGETPQEKRHQPSFLTSLVSNAIKDWNAYNDCKDREESVNPSKPNTVETWVNEVRLAIFTEKPLQISALFVSGFECLCKVREKG